MPHEPGHEEEEIVLPNQGGDDDAPPTLEETFGASDFNWQESVMAAVTRDLREAAKEAGYNQSLIDGVIAQYALRTVNYLQDTLDGWDLPAPQTTLHYDMLLRHAKTFISSQSQLIAGLNMNISGGKGDGDGTGPGTGPVGLTPEQIRQNFDLDQLTAMVAEDYRATLLDEPRDPRGIARAYVEAIVQNPDQKLDFDTYVQAQIKKQPRYQLLYGNKPRGLSDSQHMQPYVQAAMQKLRPGNVADKARAGAQLGSSPESFRANLDRSRESQVSAPFITQMNQRVTELGRVFKS